MHHFSSFTRASWETAVEQAAREEMQNLAGFNSDNFETALTTTTDADALFVVSLAVSYPFDTVVTWPGLPSHVVLSHQVEMRQIR
jgi:hypothetical protein